jgi:hypothetical protein
MGTQQLEGFSRKDLLSPDSNKYSQISSMMKVFELVLCVSVLCENKDHLINDIIMELNDDA